MRIIRGKYGRRRFDVPKNITARPTTDFARENIFNVLENIVDFEGAKALDLFAGTGAISFEFLSRGCSSVTSVEKAETQHRFIHKVSRELGATNHRIIRGDALKYIAANTSRRAVSAPDGADAAAPADAAAQTVSAPDGADSAAPVKAAGMGFDIVFADPPYDLPGFEDIPGAVLASDLIAPGGIFIIEHSAKRDFTHLPGFLDHRSYGSVNFTIFKK